MDDILGGAVVFVSLIVPLSTTPSGAGTSARCRWPQGSSYQVGKPLC